MVGFFGGLAIGLGIGAIIVPITMWILWKTFRTLERRKIKGMIARGEFLRPIDAKDFDAEAWKDKITIDPNEKHSLDQKIFKREKKENGPIQPELPKA